MSARTGERAAQEATIGRSARGNTATEPERTGEDFVDGMQTGAVPKGETRVPDTSDVTPEADMNERAHVQEQTGEIRVPGPPDKTCGANRTGGVRGMKRAMLALAIPNEIPDPDMSGGMSDPVQDEERRSSRTSGGPRDDYLSSGSLGSARHGENPALPQTICVAT